MKKIFFVILFLSYLMPFQAQNSANKLTSEKNLNQFNIDSWSKEEGLPTNSMLDICQTNDGYLWLASYYGLIKFDGVNFKVFNEFNTNVFKGSGVGALDKDKNGTLWITTQNNGLVTLKNGEFKAYGPEQGIIHLFNVIFIDSKNRVWAASSEGGLFYFENEKFKFLENSDNLINTEIQSFAEDDNGVIWIGTEGEGLFKYEDNTISQFSKQESLNYKWIKSLLFYNGILWIGADDGLVTYDGNVLSEIDELKGFFISHLLPDESDNIWIATLNGLFRRNKLTDSYEYLNTKTGLFKDNISKLLIDFENSLWMVNYKAGISRLKNGKFVFFNEEKGMSGSIVNSVFEIEPEVYLIAYDNGYMYKIENNEISNFVTKSNLSGKRVRNVFKDSKNNLWISTYDGLLRIYPNKREKWYSPENGFPGKYIRLVFEDKFNNLWIGTRHSGLIKFDENGKYTTIDKKVGLGANLIMSIDEDAEGNLLVGTSKGGLSLIKNKQIIKTYSINEGLSGDIIFNTYTDKEGLIWVAANGGLNYIKNNIITSFLLKDSIIKDTPFDIVEDDLGNLWIPSGKGIMKVNKEQLLNLKNKKSDKIQLKLYDKSDGLLQTECTSTSISLKTSTGILWFPTINGIAMIDPKNIPINKFIPPIYIEEFIADHNSIDINKPISLDPGFKRYSFYYTALSLTEPKNVMFKYKLEGFENEWSEPTNKRTISFTNLSPGTYTFKVIACNNDGIWNDVGKEMTFNIKPFYYQTIWFYTISGIFLIAIIFLIYRFRIKRLIKRQKNLETIVKMRTREISEKNEEISKQNNQLYNYQNHLEEQIKVRTYDLNLAKENAEKADQLKSSFLENLSHEIRTPLNAIVGYSSILKKEKELSKTGLLSIKQINIGSDALLKIIDAVVQASRLQLGDIEVIKTDFSLSVFLKSLFNEIEESEMYRKKENDIQLKLNEANLTETNLYTDKGKLYLILNNLLENAIKFTKTGIVEFGVDTIDEELIKFYVKDTGIGISDDNIKHIFEKFRKIETDRSILFSGLGLGLTITESFAKLIDGKLSVESVHGEGSTFYFSIPYQN